MICTICDENLEQHKNEELEECLYSFKAQIEQAIYYAGDVTGPMSRIKAMSQAEDILGESET